MKYGKNTIGEFAEEMQEQCQNGASQSDIIQMIDDWQKPLVHHKDTTVGLYTFDKELDNIFENIPNKEGCKTVVEAYLVQQIEYLKSIVFRIS